MSLPIDGPQLPHESQASEASRLIGEAVQKVNARLSPSRVQAKTLHFMLGRRINMSQRLVAAWLMGALVAITGCAKYPSPEDGSGELGTAAQAVGTPPASMVSCTSNAPCTMPLIAAGGKHTVAVKSDGTVWTWGSNLFGQLGNGNNSMLNSKVPVQVQGLTGVIAVAAGARHTVAIKSDGTVWAWGDNTYGQLGNNNTTMTKSVVPIQVPRLSGVNAVAAGLDHTVALDSSGTVWTWGYNSNGELGTNSSKAMSSTPTPAVWISNNPPGAFNLTAITAIAAGNHNTVAVDSSGTVWAWGYKNSTLGYSSVAVQVPGLSGVTAVAAGSAHIVVLDSNGTVWTWGCNSYGQLGYKPTTSSDSWVPAAVSGLSSVTAVAAGQLYAFALGSNGTVWAWGYNSYGQFGDGSTTSSDVPVEVLPLSGLAAVAPSALESVDSLVTTFFTVALKPDGTVWAWGYNSSGQLGDDSTSTSAPVKSGFSYQAEGCAKLPSCLDGVCVLSPGSSPGCSGHGTCPSGPSGSCSCNPGFSGEICNQCGGNGSYGVYPDCKYCLASTTCNGHGTCDQTGSCDCDPGFTGTKCNQCMTSSDTYGTYPNCKYCLASTTCNGHGTCDQTGSCDCNPGFTGTSCDRCATSDTYGAYPNCKYCQSMTTCGGNGTCDSTGGCACSSGYAGPKCEYSND